MEYLERIRAFIGRFLTLGPREALRKALRGRLFSPEELLPFARIDKAGLFTCDVEALHARDREKIRTTSFLMEASQVETSYPHHIEFESRILRYGFLPATGVRQGLVLLLHGHDAFLHMGPLRPWTHFDVLAPWDTFGYKRQGSWFWGEKGDNFTDRLIYKLLSSHLDEHPGRPWFAMGASMGGFGALWHGIKYGARAIYTQCPQVDIARKIHDFGETEPTNPYRHLRNPESGTLPDLLALANAASQLPPLMLIQNQFDFINPFADHAWRLLDIYNNRRTWYGLRVHPSIGHGGDGSQEEAELYFRSVLDKNPPPQFG